MKLVSNIDFLGILLLGCISILLYSCESNNNYPKQNAKNLLEYENIKRTHTPGIESFDSINNRIIYQVYFDEEQTIEMEHFFYSKDYKLKEYDFHFIVKNDNTLLFNYNYENNDYCGATYFIVCKELKKWEPLSDSIILYFMVASPPGFISETKLFNFNSNGKGEININRTNKISNNIFIIYKDDFNMTDTFCLINNLKNITTTKPNNNISDTLYFTFGNNREDYLAPKMRGAP